MKKFLKYNWLVMFTCLVALSSHARTITIQADGVKKNLTQYLRQVGETCNRNDSVVLIFGSGSYTIDGSIVFKSHLTIKGEGAQRSIVFFDKGNDRPGFKAFTADCFIDVFGTPAQQLSLSISDISFRVKEHKGIWWDEKSNYLFKIRHCNSVNIHHIKSYNYNASLTNFDLQVCSNVNITDCDITNYNNSHNGGCLWLRGEMHNVNIKRNKIVKYGKDEAVAIFDRLVDHSKKYIRGKVNRTDIFIEDNEFYYGWDEKDKKKEPLCDMIVSLFTDHRASEDRCMTSNFHLRGNTFHINDICTRCIYVGFDPADDHRDIYIENNEIIHSPLSSNDPFYYSDIEIHDQSASTDVIHINGNSLKNDNAIVNKFGTTGFAFIVMRGGQVSMADNRVVNNVTRNPQTGKPYGIELVWCKSDANSIVSMTGNVCKGLDCVAHFGAWEFADAFSLHASNNYFAGNTRVLCESVRKLDLDFKGNTFSSQVDEFFLDGFAQKGTVMFKNNDVTVNTGNGQFMTRKQKSQNRIDKLEIKNNVFKGVKSESEMLKNATNVRKRKISNNSISR